MEGPALLLTLTHMMWGGLECSVKQVHTEAVVDRYEMWDNAFPQSNLLLLHPAINCDDPGTPANGQRSLSSTTYNSIVTYTCDVGYTLQGANSRTCQSDGQWSGSVPQCTGMLCI